MTLPDQITLMEALLKENPDARVCDLWELLTSGKPVFFTRQSKMNEWTVEVPEEPKGPKEPQTNWVTKPVNKYSKYQKLYTIHL